MSKPKIFIAIPAYRNIDAGFAQSLLKFQRWAATQDTFDWCMDMVVGDSLVNRARNTLTARFLNTDCTHLLFLDSDLIFEPQQIELLVKDNKDIVAGNYFKKNEDAAQLVMNCHPNVASIDYVDDFLADVAYVGTGFMLIRKEVFQKMIDTYKDDIEFKEDSSERTEWDFWRVGVYKYKDGSKRFLSEDWMFCQIALDLGYKIYSDMRVAAGHVGMAVFPLKSTMKAVELRNTSDAKNFATETVNRFSVAEVASSGAKPADDLEENTVGYVYQQEVK